MNEINNVLKNIDEKSLKNLISEIMKNQAFQILEGKTQIKNSAVENNNEYGVALTNRRTHSSQVSKIAYQIVKSSGRSEKEALVAQLVGLCHDLGHTPFGHDGEIMFSEKTGKKFEHAKYGAKVFDKIFRNIINSKNPKTGKNLFNKETKESLEELQLYVKAGIFAEDIIQNLKELGEYIKSGVDLHTDGYYSYTLDEKMKTAEGEELEVLKRALENPCIQAGMLADTVAIMQSDVRDMLNAKNPFDESKTVISLEEQFEVTKNIGFTTDDINILKKQLLSIGKIVNLDGLDTDEALMSIIKEVNSVMVDQIQKIISENIGKKGLNEKGRFESIPDEYKLLLDNNEKGYRDYLKSKGISKKIGNWEEYRAGELTNQRNLLKEKNPLLCLTYEIQNELMYGKVLSRDKIKILNNEVDRNSAIFSRTYDYLYKIASTNTNELKNEEEIELKKELDKMYVTKSYPKYFSETGRDRRINKSAVIKNLVIFKMQQMGNAELKSFYENYIGSQEKNILDKIEIMEQQGKSEEEMLAELQEINLIGYEAFKREEGKRIEQIEGAEEGLGDEEIALKLGIEKSEIDELRERKIGLARYVKYTMGLRDIEKISGIERDTTSLEQVHTENKEKGTLDSITEYSVVAEFHDQKSDQFFEDIASGKYTLLENVIRLTYEGITAKDMIATVGVVSGRNLRQERGENEINNSQLGEVNEEK